MKSIPTENGVLVHKSEIERQRRDNEWPRDGESWPAFLDRIDREARPQSRKVNMALIGMFLAAILVGAVMKCWDKF